MPQTLQSAILGAADSPSIILPKTNTSASQTISYAGLHDQIAKLQAKLAGLGIRQASPVSMALTNSPELVVAFLAASNQRAIAAPLNPTYKQEEFEFYVGDVGSELVLVPKGAMAGDAASVRAARSFGAAIAECWWDHKSAGVVLDVKELGKLSGRGKQPIAQARADDVALILHTRSV